MFSEIASHQSSSICTEIVSGSLQVAKGCIRDLFIFGRFHSRPGNEAKVLKTLLDVVTPTRAEHGCISINAFRSTQDPQLFYIHTHWENEAVFKKHLTLQHTIRFIEHMTPLIDHLLELTKTEKVE
jgi:quinol monooxygenase YgiN